MDVETVIQTLSQWESYIYSNDKSFLEEFVLDPDAHQVAATRFSEQWVDFTYVDTSGTQIMSSIGMSEFLTWLYKGTQCQSQIS